MALASCPRHSHHPSVARTTAWCAPGWPPGQDSSDAVVDGFGLAGRPADSRIRFSKPQSTNVWKSASARTTLEAISQACSWTERRCHPSGSRGPRESRRSWTKASPNTVIRGRDRCSASQSPSVSARSDADKSLGLPIGWGPLREVEIETAIVGVIGHSVVRILVVEATLLPEAFCQPLHRSHNHVAASRPPTSIPDANRSRCSRRRWSIHTQKSPVAHLPVTKYGSDRFNPRC